MRGMLKGGCALFMLLGITSSIGAGSSGNAPWASLILATASLLGVIILNA